MWCTNNRRGAVISLMLFSAMAFTGCGASQDNVDLKPIEASRIGTYSCKEAELAKNDLKIATDMPQGGNRVNAFKELGLNDTEMTISSVNRRLNNRLDPKDCSMQPEDESRDETAGDNGDNKAGDNGQAMVTERNGKKRTVPVVTTAGTRPTVDTTNDPMTPASIPVGLCPTLVDWKSLTTCVDDHDLSWYVQGVNQRETMTGFNWSDIEHWANAKNAKTAEVRAIEVFGQGTSNAEARKRAAELVGNKVARTLAIVNQPACFNNTRGLEDEVMQDFVYCPPNSRQVRVSLLPAVMEKGKIVGIRDTDSGVFIDCINLWWIPELITVPGQPPQQETPPVAPPPVVPPENGGPPPSTPPGDNPPPVCPPGMHGTPPICKDGAESGPAHNPQLPEQQKPNPLPATPEDKQQSAPVKPSPTYESPAPAQPTKTPRPTPPPPAESEAPQPTDPGDECIPGPGKDSCD